MLRLFIQQLPIIGTYTNAGQEIHYEGLTPQTIQTLPSGLPVGSPRRWENYGTPIDITQYVSDVNALKIEWSITRDENGKVQTGEFKPVKSTSGDITFERHAYDLLKAWLIDDVSASLNIVSVSIHDTDCGWFTGYVIKPSDLTWCETGICTFDANIKMMDEQLNCLRTTLVADNWQGWFQKVPLNNKKHPRFSYCNEVRPGGTLTIEWYLMINAFALNILLVIPLILFINGFIFLLNSIFFTINLIINAVNNLPGVNIATINYINPISFNNLTATFDAAFIESAGCGREHPAPLIRDYITNVCDKCGVKVTPESAPIFFMKQIPVSTSGRGILNNVSNPHYNACYLNAAVNSGLRRFNSIGLFTGFHDPNGEYWIPDNQPLLYLDMFLDEIKGIYNSEWRVSQGVLYFQRKDWFQDDDPVYDFSFGSSDRNKILEGVCYTPNDNKYPASCIGIYSPDGMDASGNQSGNINGVGQMNGVVDFASTDQNPNFTGILDKSLNYGATRFRFDGVDHDYIYDALQLTLNGFSLTVSPGLTFYIIENAVQELDKYAAYGLLLSGEAAMFPKIIIWDGQSFENAKAIRNKSAYPGTNALPTPDINPLYNSNITPSISQPWEVKHQPQSHVKGQNFTIANDPPGIYKVTDYFGFVVTEREALLINYPMYFEPNFLDTLWDWFHWIDDPRRFPKLNKDWRVKIRYCYEDAKKLNLLDDASGIKLLQRITLPTGYYQDGRLKEIEINFDPSDQYGQYIELRGDV